MSGANRRSGQAAIETIIALPLALTCAWGLVDAGIAVADQVALRSAASSTAVASISGDDATDAARTALPTRLADSVVVHESDSGISLSVRSRSTLLSLIPSSRLRADAVTATKEDRA